MSRYQGTTSHSVILVALIQRAQGIAQIAQMITNILKNFQSFDENFPPISNDWHRGSLRLNIHISHLDSIDTEAQKHLASDKKIAASNVP